MVASNQNTLEISLDEPVVFLNQKRDRRSKSPLPLRGQLSTFHPFQVNKTTTHFYIIALTLVKPISITSIEVSISFALDNVD